MKSLAQTCERIAATTKKLEKIAIVAGFLNSVPAAEASVAAVFFSGSPFPVWEETTLQVGGTLLWRLVQELSAKSEAELTAAYRKLGDLGAVAGEELGRAGTSPVASLGRAQLGGDLSLIQVQAAFRRIAAARGPTAKSGLVRE